MEIKRTFCVKVYVRTVKMLQEVKKSNTSGKFEKMSTILRNVKVYVIFLSFKYDCKSNYMIELKYF